MRSSLRGLASGADLLGHQPCILLLSASIGLPGSAPWLGWGGRLWSQRPGFEF